MDRISEDWTRGHEVWCKDCDDLWLLLEEPWFWEFKVVAEFTEVLEECECEPLLLLLSLHLSQKLPEYPDSVD